MNPTEKLYWLKDNKKFNLNSHIYHMENYIISEIILRYPALDYQGEYKCIAANSLGTSTKSIELVSLVTTTITTITSMESKYIYKRKRTKYTRMTTTTEVSYSTENLRMMTITSKGK